MAKSASDLLKKVAKSATKKSTGTKKKDDRWTIHLDESDFSDALDLCQLSTITGQLEATRKERDKTVKSELLKQFCKKWFDEKALPQNPKIVLRKDGSDDMSFLFQVKFRKAGLTGVIPNVEDLPEEQTVEELLQMMLTSPKVGLSGKKADSLLEQGEIYVQQVVQLADSLDALLEAQSTESAATKLLTYIACTDGSEIEPLSQEERSALLQTTQVVCLKDGFFERAHMFVDSADQLIKLIDFVKGTLSIGSYEFAISDTPNERADRLKKAAVHYIGD